MKLVSAADVLTVVKTAAFERMAVEAPRKPRTLATARDHAGSVELRGIEPLTS